jgi:hypothetical protein
MVLRNVELTSGYLVLQPKNQYILQYTSSRV